MKPTILILLAATNLVHAGSPVWTFTTLTPTSLSVPSNGTAVVQYTVTNQSRKTHTLVMNAIPGISQDTSGSYCKNPFVLGYQQSCRLSVLITGSQLTGNVNGGPVVCEQASQGLQCYQPSAANALNVKLTTPTSTPTINITAGSPLTLTTNGASGTITVKNTSADVAATNVTAQLIGTALFNNVTVDERSCTSIPPQGSCNLIFTPSSTAVPATSFNIRGTNTNSVSASITIQSVTPSISPSSGSSSGGVSVTITGPSLTGTSNVTFDGQAATNFTVVNDTTIKAVAPRHTVGIVPVQVTTPSTTLTYNFTYVAPEVGLSAYGGTIACLNGSNLIAASVDNSPAIQWGGSGITTSATSDTNGAANTATIISTLGANGGVVYAAQLCAQYTIDYLGNSPCTTTPCYDQWFLPSGSSFQAAPNTQLYCLFSNKTQIGGFANDIYWGSTEYAGGASRTQASVINMSNGGQGFLTKTRTLPVRCVRAFIP